MIKRRIVFTVAVIAFCGGLGGYAMAQTSEAASTTETPNSIRSATELTIHGKITAVDTAKKLVTLEADGKSVTFKVENPYNLKEAKVGDPVVIRYYEVVTVRKKKKGEELPAVSLSEGIATAKSGTPGAVAKQKTSVLVTITAINTQDGTVTIKGPDGSSETVKARDPNNLKHLKVGDEMVVTITVAAAIAIEKEKAAG